MSCKKIEERLLDDDQAFLDRAVREHLKDCPACSTYAARLDLARQLLGEHHAGVEPDAGFAARVVAALPGTPGLVSRAAMKLLPAALALVLVLAGWCLIDTHGPADLLEQARTSGEQAPTDEPLSWALESNGEAS